MLRGGAPDFEAMTMAQMISGLAMQMLGNSRAASGAEHLIAHLVEMKPPRFENAARHPRRVRRRRHRHLRRRSTAAWPAKPRRPGPSSPCPGAGYARSSAPSPRASSEENKNDVLASFDPQNIVDNWQAIREHRSPPSPLLKSWPPYFKDLGGKYRLPDIGIDEALEPEILDISAAIRNRLTLARMRRVLDFEE